MAISKRVRFEVLRRDNHTCRYCGGAAPGVEITVDHVVPVSLGGSDDPSNLVAACRDCNSGKASTNPESPVVQSVADDALRWAAAVQAVAKARAKQRGERDAYFAKFLEAWRRWRYGSDDDPKTLPLPPNVEPSIWRFFELAVPVDDLLDCVQIACSNDRIRHEEAYRYFAGCVWRIVTEMQEAARSVVTVEEVDSGT